MATQPTYESAPALVAVESGELTVPDIPSRVVLANLFTDLDHE
jgi:hypothetical protein